MSKTYRRNSEGAFVREREARRIRYNEQGAEGYTMCLRRGDVDPIERARKQSYKRRQQELNFMLACDMA